MGKRAGEVRLVGQAGCRSNIGGGHTAREKVFGAPQANSHEHLMRGDVKVQFELALKMPWAERSHASQFVERNRVHVVIMQIFAHAIKAMRAFPRHRRMTSQWLEGVDQIEQQSFCASGSSVFHIPWISEQIWRERWGSWRVTSWNHQWRIGDLLQKRGVEINHPVAPAVGGFSLAGVQLIGIHGHDGMGRCHVLGATIAKTLGAGFDRANAKRFVGMRLKRVTRDMRMIQLNARYLRQMAKRALSFSSINCSGTPCTLSLPTHRLIIIREDARGCHRN